MIKVRLAKIIGPIVLWLFMLLNLSASIDYWGKSKPRAQPILGSRKSFRTFCLEGGRAGYMSHIGVMIRENIKRGKVIFPEDTGQAHSSFKDVLGKSSSEFLPFKLQVSTYRIANVDLLRLALHAFPVIIRKQSYDYQLNAQQYTKLKNHVIFRDIGEGLEVYIVSLSTPHDEYFVYLYGEKQMFLVPANWQNILS